MKKLLLLAAAGLAAPFLALEAGLRLTLAFGPGGGPAPGSDTADFSELTRPSPHPEIGVELRPGLDVRFKGKRFRTNSAGLRGPEASVAKPAGAWRIAGIGDSVMMGWGADQDRTYLSLLESSLNAKSPRRRVEALNFAVSGYNTRQEYFVLRDRALAYRPDLVILGYVGNDPGPPNFNPFPPRFSCASYALNFLVLRLEAALGLRFAVEGDWRPRERVRPPDPGGWQGAFEGIAALCRKAGIPALVVLDSRYQNERIPHRQVVELARANGMLALDLHRLYRKLPETTPRSLEVKVQDEHNRLYSIPGDTHSNEAWHERTAGVLARTILEARLLPDR